MRPSNGRPKERHSRPCPRGQRPRGKRQRALPFTDVSKAAPLNMSNVAASRKASRVRRLGGSSPIVGDCWYSRTTSRDILAAARRYTTTVASRNPNAPANTPRIINCFAVIGTGLRRQEKYATRGTRIARFTHHGLATSPILMDDILPETGLLKPRTEHNTGHFKPMDRSTSLVFGEGNLHAWVVPGDRIAPCVHYYRSLAFPWEHERKLTHYRGPNLSVGS